MGDISNKLITLCLNKQWKIIGYRTVKDAIISLTGSEAKPDPTSMALDIDYELNDDGTPNFSKVSMMRPVKWSEWITLKIRDWDLCINGTNRSYRVPTVIISVNYSDMPVKSFSGRPSSESIFLRDGYIDQYTGKKLSRENATADHVIPKHRGGKDTWENLVTCDKTLNGKKGHKLNSEVGLKLLKNPVAPRPIPFSHTIKEAKHRDHAHFIIKS